MTIISNGSGFRVRGLELNVKHNSEQQVLGLHRSTVLLTTMLFASLLFFGILPTLPLEFSARFFQAI
jgi:hypothetical protein